jgi:plastocyanin
MTTAIAIAVLSGTLVHDARPVQHAAILLETAGKAAAPRTARVDEVWLSFVPKVQVVAPGSTLVFVARDADSHTVHGWYRGKTLFNKASVPNGPEQRVQLDGEGIVTFNCELHAQMRAWVVVSSAAFSAVSDAEGKWSSDAPPGRYRVRIWQPGNAEPIDVGDRELAAGAAIEAPPPPEHEAPLHDPPWELDPPLHVSRGQVTYWPHGRLATILSLVGAPFSFGLVWLLFLLGARLGWPPAACVAAGCALALGLGALAATGLAIPIATALGFGAFLGTVILLARRIQYS